MDVLELLALQTFTNIIILLGKTVFVLVLSVGQTTA